MTAELKSIINEFIENSRPIKLHLGCGPNILDGYINVDGEYLKDNPDVVLHDISTQLPVTDNSVEEILTVHVIEHLIPSDVSNMLSDWLRVLKVGGSVAIEWPDLYKICKFLVDDPSRFYSKSSKIQKRGVAGIFGNLDRYKDVAMLHKWGYSADAMKLLLEEHGFKNVRIEDNIYPKTEMCSRVVGYKL